MATPYYTMDAMTVANFNARMNAQIASTVRATSVTQLDGSGSTTAVTLSAAMGFWWEMRFVILVRMMDVMNALDTVIPSAPTAKALGACNVKLAGTQQGTCASRNVGIQLRLRMKFAMTGIYLILMDAIKTARLKNTGDVITKL